jgi:hypothetical protein
MPRARSGQKKANHILALHDVKQNGSQSSVVRCPLARTHFVLDCFVTMAWCFDDLASPYTSGVRDSLANLRAAVPSLWPLEVVNATIVGERRKRLDEARSQRFMTLVEALPVIIDDETAGRAFGDIAHLARAHHLSSY